MRLARGVESRDEKTAQTEFLDWLIGETSVVSGIQGGEPVAEEKRRGAG